MPTTPPSLAVILESPSQRRGRFAPLKVHSLIRPGTPRSSALPQINTLSRHSPKLMILSSFLFSGCPKKSGAQLKLTTQEYFKPDLGPDLSPCTESTDWRGVARSAASLQNIFFSLKSSVMRATGYSIAPNEVQAFLISIPIYVCDLMSVQLSSQ